MKLSLAIKISFDMDNNDQLNKVQKIVKQLQKVAIVEDLEAVDGTNVYKLIKNDEGGEA